MSTLQLFDILTNLMIQKLIKWIVSHKMYVNNEYQLQFPLRYGGTNFLSILPNSFISVLVRGDSHMKSSHSLHQLMQVSGWV